jgi:hypothetical protein
MRFARVLVAWLAATAVTALVGSIIQTQFNLAAIAQLGASAPPGVRLQTTLQDITGFAPRFAAIVAAGFGIAFPVAALLRRLWPGGRTLLCMLAGVAAIAASILLMNAVVPITPIGATRSAAGLMAVSLAGAPGGWVYSRLASGGRRRLATGGPRRPA